MKKIISAFTLLLLIFAIPTEAFGEDFDGLEGVIVLNPSDEDAKTSSNTSNSGNEGLDLTVKENAVERISETYSNIILNVSLMNWDVSGYQLDDAVSAQLYYQDQFEYPATMDFHGETEIGMLVNLDGTLTFTVPNIVAMADKDSIELELVVLGETYTEELDLTAAAKKVFEEVGMPFDYENRGNDELELNLGSIQIFDTWKGEKDEKYKWIVQDFSMINWSGSQKEINESLYVLLTYMDEYGFEAQVEFPQEQLDSLEMVQGSLIFHVPVIVTTAEEGTLALQMNLSDNEWVEDFDISKASVLDNWGRLNTVFPYESENAVKDIDRYTEGNAENILEWNNHFYLMVEVSDPYEYYYAWDETKEYCEKMGGHLATITSEEEQEVIENYLESYAEYDHYWLGGYRESGDSWKWITGEECEVYNWDSGEPNGTGDYIEIYSDGTWDDTHNDNTDMEGYICEWEF